MKLFEDPGHQRCFFGQYEPSVSVQPQIGFNYENSLRVGWMDLGTCVRTGFAVRERERVKSSSTR